MSADHVFILGSDFVSDGVTAGCSCGWEGRHEHEDADCAVDEWENHCDVVFMEATS